LWLGVIRGFHALSEIDEIYGGLKESADGIYGGSYKSKVGRLLKLRSRKECSPSAMTEQAEQFAREASKLQSWQLLACYPHAHQLRKWEAGWVILK
jgi:hypothetical protein